MDLLQITDFSDVTFDIQRQLLEDVWKQNIDVVKHMLHYKCPPVSGVMSAACGTGNVEMVRLLANAWKGLPGCAIGGHGMDSVLQNKDVKMLKCLIGLNLLSETAIDLLAYKIEE